MEYDKALKCEYYLFLSAFTVWNLGQFVIKIQQWSSREGMGGRMWSLPWRGSLSPLPLEDSAEVNLTPFIPFSPIPHHPHLLGSTVEKAMDLVMKLDVYPKYVE